MTMVSFFFETIKFRSRDDVKDSLLGQNIQYKYNFSERKERSARINDRSEKYILKIRLLTIIIKINKYPREAFKIHIE